MLPKKNCARPVNGGYVRDLLLGKRPDDLDVSLCLRDCAEDVTIENVMAELHGFAESRPERPLFFSKSRCVPTANAEVPCRSEGI